MAAWNALVCDHCGTETIVESLRRAGVAVSADEYVQQVRDHLVQILLHRLRCNVREPAPSSASGVDERAALG